MRDAAGRGSRVSGLRWIQPPRLAPGARVALIAPAGPVGEARIRRALARVRRLGLEAVEGAAIRERAGYLAGGDLSRARDLAWALSAPDIDAVWTLRGGYGSMRLWSRLDLARLRSHPRPFIGFSDNTSLHLAAQVHRVVSFHGPHAGAERLTRMTTECLRRVLWRAQPAGVLPAARTGPSPAPLVGGRADGRLAGGNLSLLAAAAGTPYALNCQGRLLVLEEVDERVYRVDRMLEQLAASGALAGVRGLAVGRFTEIRTETRGRSLAVVLEEFARSLGVPAVTGLPIGHVVDNWTLPLGARARLDADAGTLEILEPAVRT
ncbi:MAG TPA: LD-carboxypeptidase [Longimicrobiales bacterium]|nr:LD-carboxypeptidase [Longimicrobiales bacterium]